MHHVKLILLLYLCIGLSANAQTPYDSFAPETSRPMLTSGALSREKCAQDFSSDTTLLVAMIDTQQERILLVNMSDGSIVAYALLTDNKSHWLSPDPLFDKYPSISPYAYCNWNPVKYIDPDGRYFDEANEQIAQRIEYYVKSRREKTNDTYRAYQYSKTLKDICAMRRDKQHEFRFIQNNGQEAKKYGLHDESGVDILEHDESKIGIFADFESLEKKLCDETIAHEIRHGGQIARGKLILKTDQSNYNTKHEVDAYRAQWSWSNNGFYLETTLNENGQLITPFKINRKFIYTILNKQKKLLYENLPY